MKLYPPQGGEPITPHPSKVDEMIAKGWLKENKPVKNLKTGVK